MSTTGKIFTVIFSILLVGLIAFGIIWGVNNSNSLKEGLSGSNLYTEEDLKKAHEEGYNEALNTSSYPFMLNKILSNQEYKNSKLFCLDWFSPFSAGLLPYLKKNNTIIYDINGYDRTTVKSLELTPKYYNTPFFGENFKITEIQSAIALEQLKKINKIIDIQEKNYQFIIDRIDTTYYKLRPLVKGAKSFKMSLGIIFDSEEKCRNFIEYMNSNGIGFNVYCSNLIDKYDTFKYKNSWHKSGFPYSITEYIPTKCKSAEILFKRVAWFNLSAELNKKHLKYIVLKLEDYKNEQVI